MDTPKKLETTVGIPLSAIINELINRYGLDESDEAKNNLRREILYICEKTPVSTSRGETTLREIAKKGHGKERPRYVFTEEQKELIIHSEKLLNYISASYPESDISKAIERERKTDKFIKAEIAGLASEIDGSLDLELLGVTEQEIRHEKLSMMVEALFSVFFTEFDVEALRRDMAVSTDYQTPLEISSRNLEAQERLSNPEGNYFKRRPDTAK